LEAGETTPGDMNGDGVADLDDLPDFVRAVLVTSADEDDICRIDFNRDGMVNAADIAGMTTAILGAIPALFIDVPGGPPASVAQAAPTTFDVRITSGSQLLVPGTAMLHYRSTPGGFNTSISLSPLGSGLFTATLSGFVCADQPEFYLSAQGDGGGTVYDPPGAPSRTYDLSVGMHATLLDDDFEMDLGWTVSGDAFDGHWERGVPVNGGRGDPVCDADGSGQCYVTDNVAGNSDVDGGSTILTSPVIDASNGATVSYAYWLNDIDGGPLGVEDSLTVEFATDAAGSNWQLVRSYDTASGGWRSDSFGVPPTSTLRIRFTASDLLPGDVVEAGIDAVLVSEFVCGP